MYTPAVIRRGLPNRIKLSETRRLIKDVHRCETWSYHASIDADRTEMFEREPAWCVDFSEVRGFIERNTQQIATIHLFDYVLSNTDTLIYILPGTVFEMVNYLDALLLRQHRRPAHAKRAAELRQAVTDATDPQKAAERILKYVFTSASADLEDTLDVLRAVHPTATRLRDLLNSPQIRFFHRDYAHDAKALYAFPGYFDQVYHTLNVTRNAKKLNNYNDALNLTICYSANMNNLGGGHAIFFYVTRDKACTIASERHTWEYDPIRELDADIRSPLCRDPYSAVLYIGERRQGTRRTDKLYLNAREFLTKLTRTPEYRQAVKACDSGATPEEIEIQFDVRTSEQHQQLRQSLAILLRNFGALVFRVLAVTDQRRLEAMQPTPLGEFPERQFTMGTQSLEKLSATFGLVYREMLDNVQSARQLVNEIDRVDTAPALEMAQVKNAEFACTTFIVRTHVGREGTLCTIDVYDGYYSMWWSSSVTLWAFLDIVTFFWHRAAAADAAVVGTRSLSPFLDEEEKVFPTGYGLAMHHDEDADVLSDVEMMEMPDLVPFTHESVAMIQKEVNVKLPFSIRINTRAGDFWYNLRTIQDMPARMGLVSHWRDADVLAKIVASTNVHFANRDDLRDLLGRIK